MEAEPPFERKYKSQSAPPDADEKYRNVRYQQVRIADATVVFLRLCETDTFRGAALINI